MSKTTKTPILNGILQGTLDANGFGFINLTGAGAGTVTSVTGDDGSHVGLTLTVASPTAAPVLTLGGTLNWTSLNKSGSSLADLATRTFASLTSIPSNVTNALNSTLNLSDLPNPGTARTNLGLGTIATHSAGDYLAVGNNLSDTDDNVVCRANLGLATVAATGAYSDLSGKPTVPTISGSVVLKGSSGNAVAATARTDYWDTTQYGGGSTIGLVPSGSGSDSTKFLTGAGTWTAIGAGGVTAFTVVNANGFYGSVANSASTPALTIFLADSGDATKKAHFVLSGVTTGNDRAITVPDAASTTVVADTGASHNFLTAISAAGAISKAQPAFTDISGSVAAGQMPALTGDVTSSAGAVATTIANTVVTYAKMQNVTTGKVVGRNTAGTGSAGELSGSDVLELDGAATRGDIYYRGASGWVRLSASTSGFFLKTNGAGSDPTWSAASTGALPISGGTLTGEVIVSAATGPTDVASVGFRGSPINTQNTAYTLVLTDAGKTIYHSEATTARPYTIPANASVAFPIGTIITISNKAGSGNITLSINSDTLQRADGTAGTGSRTIAPSSDATIQKMETTVWKIVGKFT